MDLGKTSRNNYLITIFVTGLIRILGFNEDLTSLCAFNGSMCTRSAGQKTLDDLFSNCLISVSVRGSNVSIMDTFRTLLSMENPVINSSYDSEVWSHDSEVS